MNENAACPIWGTPASKTDRTPAPALVESPRAGGEYWITSEARAGLPENNEAQKARLTSWLVEQRRLGEKRPLVIPKVIEDAKRRPRLSVHERADRLFLMIASQASDVAETFPYYLGQEDSEIHGMLAWSESLRLEEVGCLEAYLETRGWIERPCSEINLYRISVEGHARLTELAGTETESSKAFVAMWFDESMGEVWDNAIRPGIEGAGYEAMRIDKKEHVGKIDDEIIAELRRARFVVADFTQGKDGPRGGVYYEAGFAHGRDIPVIFSCREDAIEKVHFDTRQYNHIVWEMEKLDEFRDRLKTRISAVIGDGPLGK